MSSPWEGAERERERRQREFKRMAEKRQESLQRELTTKKLVTDDIEKLDRPVSEAEYYKDCTSDLHREMIEAERNRR